MLSRWRSTIRDDGWRAVSSGRVPGKSGRWSNGQCRLPVGSGIAAGKMLASLLSTLEIDAVIRSEGRETQTVPVEQILRDGQGDPRAFR